MIKNIARQMSLRARLNLYLIGLVVTLSLCLGVYSSVTMEEKVLDAAQEKLKGDLAFSRVHINSVYPGDWEIRDDKLFKGSVLINNNFDTVDQIRDITGDTATIFQGNTRVATNVKKPDGSRAVGTEVAQDIADVVLNQGQTFYGKAQVVGTWNETAYEPIKDKNGKVIGILYVGVPRTTYEKMITDFNWKISGFALLGVVLAVGLALRLSASIVNPVRELMTLMNATKSGDLTKVSASDRQDELGELLSAYNTMVNHLRELVGEVTNSTKLVTGTVFTLRGVAKDSASNTELISRRIEEIAVGSRNQVNSIRETVEVMSNFSGTINQVAADAEDQSRKSAITAEIVEQVLNAIDSVAVSTQAVATNASKTSVAAQQGSASVKNSIAGMERIKKQVFDTANQIKGLGAHSEHIGEIVQVIDDIAEQTNLLALNAAIEAARAGEHGKGFAVVADEVRKLAERSSKATKEIGVLIGSIQNGIRQAVSNMDVGTNEVKEGTQLAYTAGESLERILDNISETDDQVQSISAVTEQISASAREAVDSIKLLVQIAENNNSATEEMAAGSSQVTESVKEIEAISQQGAASAQEITALTEQMAGATEEIAHSVEELTGMAQGLEQLVNKFKIL